MQSILAWCVLAASVVLAVAGALGGIWRQPGWTAEGVLKLAVFTAGYALLVGIGARFRPRFVPWLFIALAIGYATVAAGPAAVLGVGWMTAGVFATGAWILQSRLKFISKYPAAVAMLGLAVWALFTSVTASVAIHYRWVYGLAFLIPILQVFRLRLVQSAMPALPATSQEAIWTSLAMFPVALNWVVALKPEVSADGLAIHLPLAARMASRHFWAFDGAEFSWAVKPMNGDWLWSIAYLLGGEGAAKLLNVVLLGLICWLLYTWLHELAPGKIASLLTAGFGSTPLVLRVTGSLDVENVAAAFFLAALIYYRRYLKAGKLSDALATGVLTGAAAGTSLAAAAVLVPFGLAALLTLRLRHAIYAGGASLAAGLYPYLTALVRTGNPIFPHMNHYFRSPLFDSAAPIVDPGATAALNWRTWYDIAFHTSRFGDGGDGSFGFLFLAMAPLALIAVRRTWPRVGLAALWTAFVGGVAVFLIRPDVRHLYAVLPMLTVACGVAVASLRAYSRPLEHVITALCAVSVVANVALMPVAATQHADFFMAPGAGGAAAEAYLGKYAPERPLVNHLNRIAPNGRAAWMESGAVADFTGRSYTNTDHSFVFWRALRTSTAAEGHLYQAGERQIEYFISPSANSDKPLTNVFTREFLDVYTKPVEQFGGLELRKLAPERRTANGFLQPYATPGAHDELNSFVRYEGAWLRALHLPNALKGTLAYTNDARSRVLIRFEGRAVTLIHTAAANRCSLLVSLDGADSVVLNEYSEKARWQARSTRFEAPAGYHLLTVRFPQPREGTSSVVGCFADLDGFIVE